MDTARRESSHFWSLTVCYDHMEEDEAKVMEAKQEQVLASLGITRD